MTIFKFVLPVLVLFSIQSSSNYSNSTYDYSFELAKGWKVIPQEDFKNSLTRAGLDKDAFVEGFYKYPKKYFRLVHILIHSKMMRIEKIMMQKPNGNGLCCSALFLPFSFHVLVSLVYPFYLLKKEQKRSVSAKYWAHP